MGEIQRRSKETVILNPQTLFSIHQRTGISQSELESLMSVATAKKQEIEFHIQTDVIGVYIEASR